MTIFRRLKAGNKRLDNKFSEWRFKSKRNCLIDSAITIFIKDGKNAIEVVFVPDEGVA